MVEKLKEKDYTDQGVAQPKQGSLGVTLFLLVGFLPALFGAITNFIPFFMGKKIANDKVEKIEFFSSVRLGTYMGTYMVQYFILLILSFLIGNLWVWLAVLATPLLGYFSVQYFDKMSLWREARKVSVEERKGLMKERLGIMGDFNE